jgi:hypothetical protein
MVRLRLLGCVLLLSGLLSVAAPVSAQGGPGNSGNSGCTQTATGGGGATTGGQQQQTNRGASQEVLVSVITAAVQNVSVLNNLDTALSALDGANVQVVCLTDVLNQNDIRILQDILNNSPILNNNLNNSLNNNTVLNNVLQNANLALLNNVQVIAVNLGAGQVFAMPRA